MTERCTNCDRPEATEADYEAFGEGEGEHLCWGCCAFMAVDWRRRALVAEALLGCAKHIFAALERQRLAYRRQWGGPDVIKVTDAQGTRLLLEDPRYLMEVAPGTRPIIESALAQRGVGLEELE